MISPSFFYRPYFFAILGLFLLASPATHAAGEQAATAVSFKRTPRPAAEYKNPLPIHQAIQSATEVRIYGQHSINHNQQAEWDASPFAILNDHSHKDMFRLLKTTNRFGDFGIKSGFKYIFVLFVPGKPLQAYNYNGVLSKWNTEGEAAILPDRFVAWLRKHPYLRRYK